MHAVVELVRPGNVVMAGVGAATGAVVATGAAPALAPAVAAMLATALVTAGGNALNDARDATVDARAHPGRPIPSGRITAPAARNWAVALFASGLLVSFVVPPLAVVVVLAIAVLVAYEFGLKATGLPGNLLVASLVGLTFVAGAVAVGALPPAVWFLAGLAALANAARELVKDVEDAASDVGRRTLGQTRPRLARALAGVLVVAAVVLSALPAVWGWFSDAYVWVIVPVDVAFIAAVAVPSPRAGQRVLKVAMAGALVAFVVGAVE